MTSSILEKHSKYIIIELDGYPNEDYAVLVNDEVTKCFHSLGMGIINREKYLLNWDQEDLATFLNGIQNRGMYLLNMDNYRLFYKAANIDARNRFVREHINELPVAFVLANKLTHYYIDIPKEMQMYCRRDRFTLIPEVEEQTIDLGNDLLVKYSLGIGELTDCDTCGHSSSCYVAICKLVLVSDTWEKNYNNISYTYDNVDNVDNVDKDSDKDNKIEWLDLFFKSNIVEKCNESTGCDDIECGCDDEKTCKLAQLMTTPEYKIKLEEKKKAVYKEALSAVDGKWIDLDLDECERYRCHNFLTMYNTDRCYCIESREINLYCNYNSVLSIDMFLNKTTNA
jgi:hypothetical protein